MPGLTMGWGPEEGLAAGVPVRGRNPLRGIVVSDLISRASRCFPKHTAVIDDARRMTYRALDEASNRAASALAGLGARAGDRLMLRLPNSCEWVVLDFAAAKIGCITIPIDLAMTAQEVAAVMAATSPRFMALRAEELESFRECTEECDVRAVVVGGTPERSVFGTRFDDVLQGSASRSVDAAEGAPTDGRYLRLTSGTTGAPKAVLLTEENWIAASLSLVADRCQMTACDVVFPTSPLAQGGLTWPTATLMSGAAVVLRADRKADLVGDVVRREGVTIVQAVPTTVHRLVHGRLLSPLRAAHFRLLSYGSATIDRETILEACDVLPGRLVQGYGLTETPNTVNLASADHGLYASTEGKRAHPLGREAAHVITRIVGEDGKRVPDGTTGELEVSGPSVMAGYWQPGVGGVGAGQGPWFPTGDLVSRDDEGFIWLTGRKKDVIISGGMTVQPVEVEATLMKHPRVRDCVVAGVEDSIWGERVVAFVVLDEPGPSEGVSSDISQFAREGLAPHKRPKEVVVVPSVPRTHNGKPLRRDLVSAYLATRHER